MTTMGIIFANIYDSSLGELTNKRTMASLPYGGRYRQIDFSLSNMTNSAIRHIGIITKYNYQSLMNHIGSGQEWDLELGEGGLEFLTPFAMGHNGSYRGKLEALDSAMNFLKISTEEYVVLADSGVLVLGARWPTVPRGQALLRFGLTARHTEEMLARTAAVLAGLWEE